MLPLHILRNQIHDIIPLDKIPPDGIPMKML